MKKFLLSLFVLILALSGCAQNVGIGTTSPGAKLDITSTNSGVLIPRVALTGTGSASPLSAPATSTLVYNTATAGSGATAVSPGFYYWNGSSWTRIVDNAAAGNNVYNTDGTLTANRTVTMGADNLTFSSTTGNLIFNPSSTGFVGIGTASPLMNIDIEGGGILSQAAFGSSVTVPVSGAGTRLMWLPGFGAFRAGYVNGNQWNVANIGSYSVAMGVNVTSSSSGSVALGNGATASNVGSAAIGSGTNASGSGSSAFGINSTASGAGAFASGYGTTASGSSATAMGNAVSALSYAEVALGQYNTVYAPSSTTAWNATDRLFGIGNGASSGSPSDALVILKNGSAGIGTASPLAKLDINGGMLVRGANTNTPTTPISAVEFATGRQQNGTLVAGQTTADIAFQYGSGGYRHFIQTRHFSGAGFNTNAIDFYLNNSNTSAASSAPGTGNVNAMSITAIGVGIFNNAPTQALSVGGSNQFLVNSSGNILSINGVATSFPAAQGTAGTVLTNNGSGTLTWSGVGAGLTGGTGITISGNTINSTWTASGSNIYNNNGGYVGIGNSSPAFPVDVASGVTAAKFGTYQPVYLMSNQPMVGFNAYWNGGFLYGASSTYAGTITFGQEVGGGGFSINTAPAGTAGSAATLTSRLAITNAGFVGIGTTSPSVLQEISGPYTDLLKLSSTLGGGGNHAYIDFLTFTGTSVNGRIGVVDMGSYNGSLVFETGNASTPSTSTVERMRILNNGYVGINTTTPAYQFTIAGTGTVFAVDNTAVFAARNASSGYEQFLWPRWSDNIMYLNYGSSGFNIRNSSSTTTMFMTNGGYVGIGTTSPSYPLDVETTSGNFTGNFTFYARGCSSNYGCATGTGASTSIYAAGRMVAAEFDSYSDRRIKKDIEEQAPETSLGKADKLKVVTYHYIDQQAKGSKHKTGFIAQEVEQVLPDAVNTNEGFLPNIFEVPVQACLTGRTLTLTTSKAHGLAAGDLVRILDNSNKPQDVTVAGTDGADHFTVANWTGGSDSIFIYGKKVNDYRNLDFDQISATAIGAIQELHKKTTRLEEENKEMKAENERLRSQNNSIRSDVDRLKASLETLQQIIGSKAQK